MKILRPEEMDIVELDKLKKEENLEEENENK